MTAPNRRGFDLTTEILDVLASATTAMRTESLSRVFRAVGVVGNGGDPIPIERIDAVLEELRVAGQIERVRARGGTARYRAMN